MLNTKNFLKSISLVLMFTLVACQRPENEKTLLSISVPRVKLIASKVSAQQYSFLGHVIINVRGEGIQVPISESFDAKTEGNVSPTSLPETLTFEVPSGSARLIQVMAVYVDTATMNGEFYYGDVTQDLSGGAVGVSIPVTLAGTGMAKGGTLAGRYYDVSAVTPSGVVESRYTPTNGSPAMVMGRSQMVNGWFQAFVLDDLPLDIALLPQNVNIFPAATANGFSFLDDKSMKVIIPPHYQSQDNSLRYREGSTAVIGFFGPGLPAVNKVCYTSASHTYTQIFSDSAGANPVLWSDSSVAAANVRATKFSGVGVCAPADITNQFISTLVFDPSLINNWGSSDVVSGFYNVFSFPSNTMNGSSPVRTSYNSSGYTSSFKLLPGMPGLIDAINIYYRSSNEPRDYYKDEASACRSIVNGGYGFSYHSSIPIVAGQLDYSVIKPNPSGMSSSSVMAYCPMKAGALVGGGYINAHINYSTNTQQPTAANDFQAYTRFGSIGLNQCHQVKVNLFDNVNNSTYVSNNLQRDFNLSLSGTGGMYATEALCSSSGTAISTLSIPVNYTQSELWVKATGSVGQTLTVGVGTSVFNGGVPKTVTFNTGSPSIPNSVQPGRMELRLSASSCDIIDVYTMDSSPNLPSAVSGSNLTLTLGKTDMSDVTVSDSSFNYYASCSSTTAISSITIPVGSFRGSFAVKTGATINTVGRKISISGLGSPVAVPFNVPAQAHHLGIVINNNLPVYQGACVPVSVRAENSSNALVNSVSFDFNMNAYGSVFPGNFKTSCNGGSNNGPFTLSAGVSSSIYFQADTAGSFTMEAQSLYVSQMMPKTFAILATPGASRVSSSKVHLTSDSAMANQGILNSWPMAAFASGSVGQMSGLSTGATPASGGVNFSGSSYLMGGLFVNPSDEFLVTSRLNFSNLNISDFLIIKHPNTKYYSSVVTGGSHACAITSPTPNNLYCWGQNYSGQVGVGTTFSASSPQAVGVGASYVSAAAGFDHTCAIRSDSALECWGNDYQGAVGIGSSTYVTSPTLVDSGTSYISAAAGSSFSCGITASNQLKCWGYNVNGQLGNGSTSTMSVPVIIDSGVNYSQVDLGLNHSCGIATSGALKCWGDATYGQVGISGSASYLNPAIVDSGVSYSKVSVGGNTSCGITAGNELKCWGMNNYGQVGIGSTLTQATTPTVVNSGTSFMDVSVGATHACAITSTNELKCWGDNAYSQLGDGTATSSNIPVVVAPGKSFTKVEAGSNFTCAMSGASRFCWGANGSYQFGDTTAANSSLPKLLDDYDFRISLKQSGGNWVIAATGGWVSPPISSGSSFNLSVHRSGNSVNGYIDGAQVGTGGSGFITPPSSYNGFKVGYGMVGAVKGVIIDAGSSFMGSAGTIISNDNSHLNSRAP